MCLSVMRPVRSIDRKSTRLNSSHRTISYAVFCLTLLPSRPPLFPYTTLFRSRSSSPGVVSRHRQILSSSCGLIITPPLTCAHDASARLVDLCRQKRGPQRADVLVGNAARAVDDERLWQSPHPVVNGDAAAGVASIRIRDAELVQERLRGGSSSRVLAPRKTTSWLLSCRHIVSSVGASARHGGHQEAQKFRKITLPRRFSSLKELPSKRFRANAGAC